MMSLARGKEGHGGYDAYLCCSGSCLVDRGAGLKLPQAKCKLDQIDLPISILKG